MEHPVIFHKKLWIELTPCFEFLRSFDLKIVTFVTPKDNCTNGQLNFKVIEEDNHMTFFVEDHENVTILKNEKNLPNSIEFPDPIM